MPLTLHFGVLDIPYVEQTPPAKKAPLRRRPRPHKAHAKRYGSITTGDVAEILEAKYGVMQAFYDAHESDVLKDIENGLQGAIESFMMGAPPRLDPFGSGISQIEDRFKQFLSTGEAERVGIPGTPTEAAQRGVSHRFKHPYARRAPRPSFIDTGLYQASFKAWID